MKTPPLPPFQALVTRPLVVAARRPEEDVEEEARQLVESLMDRLQHTAFLQVRANMKK